MARLVRCPLSSLVAIFLAIQVQASQVSYRNHVGGGLASTLEEVKSKSALQLFQQWGFILPAADRDVSFAVVNTTDRHVIAGAVETQNAGKQPEIIRHWGFSHEHAFWGSPMLTAILHYLSFAVIIKAACMMSNVLFQVSPLPSVKQFQAKHDVGEADAAPFVAIAFGGCQWCFYGAFAYLVTGKSGFLVLVYSNVLGGALGMYYVQQFQENCTSTGKIHQLSFYLKVVSMLVLLQIGAMAALPREKALFFSGIISSACSVATSASALTTFPTVIKRKTAASIPLPLCIAAGVSGCLWLTCGVLLWDPYIAVPNAIGVLCNVVCVCLVFHYGTEEKGPGEFEDEGSAHLTPNSRDASPGLRERTALLHRSEGSSAETFDISSDQEWGESAGLYGACGETGGTF